MGGRIEDWIINILDVNKMTTKQIFNDIKEAGESRTYGIVSKHLRKMCKLKQLAREKVNKVYVYWNPAMIGKKISSNRRPGYLYSKIKIVPGS